MRTTPPHLAAATTSLALREPPPGLPDPNLQPPTVAEADDPFAALRVIDLVARIERGNPVRVAEIAAALNASYLDWLFTPSVVAHVLLQLQANWMADYRNASGIVLQEGAYGASVTIEDSSRVDPWIVAQGVRAARACRDRLLEFSRQDEPRGGG